MSFAPATNSNRNRNQNHNETIVQSFVRVRPLLARAGDGDERCVEHDATSVLVANKKRFANFASVFGENVPNVIVADAVLDPLLGAAMQASAGTLFAYGFSGSGKTHTLFGSASERGLWAIAAERLLARCGSGECRLRRGRSSDG
jgi:hypothetical protein